MESYTSGKNGTVLLISNADISDQYIEIPRHIERVEIDGAIMHNTTIAIKPRRRLDDPIGLFSISNVDGYGTNIIAEETTRKNAHSFYDRPDIKQLRFGGGKRRSRLPGLRIGTKERPVAIKNALLLHNTDFAEMKEHELNIHAPNAVISFKNTDVAIVDVNIKRGATGITSTTYCTPFTRGYLKPSYTR